MLGGIVKGMWILRYGMGFVNIGLGVSGYELGLKVRVGFGVFVRFDVVVVVEDGFWF